MRKRFIITGLGLIVFAAVWKFMLAPSLTQRIPAGWEWQMDYVGIQASPDEQGGKTFTKDITSNFIRKAVILAEEKRPASITIQDRDWIIDPFDKTITWGYTVTVDIDPRTGRHLKREWKDDSYLLPRFTEKKTYSFRSGYIKGVPLQYRSEEEIEGIDTYLFSYQGRGEYTECYLGSKDSPGVTVEPGQEIKCAEDQFVFKVWVEPVTGAIIKLQESCLPGDYIYDIGTGKQLAPVLRWSAITAGDDVLLKAEKARRERLRILLIGTYLPYTLLVLGVLCLGWGVASKSPSPRTRTDTTTYG